VYKRQVFTLRDQSFLELTPQDDYYAVVRKLGVPREDHWRPESGEIQYRALAYPERSYIIILMGADQDSARYVGAIDGNWKTVLHDVALPRGGSTASLLRGLRKF